jgi:hypothetical protein
VSEETRLRRSGIFPQAEGAANHAVGDRFGVNGCRHHQMSEVGAVRRGGAVAAFRLSREPLSCVEEILTD